MPLPVPTQSIAACTKTRAATLPNRAYEHARIRCRRLKFPTELYIYARRCPNAAIARPRPATSPLPQRTPAQTTGGLSWRRGEGRIAPPPPIPVAAGREPAIRSCTAAAAAYVRIGGDTRSNLGHLISRAVFNCAPTRGFTRPRRRLS